ncbi:E1 [Rhinella marina papillomavirus 1]|nr:E1 [Rhinella marina papillomavirus 1]
MAEYLDMQADCSDFSGEDEELQNLEDFEKSFINDEESDYDDICFNIGKSPSKLSLPKTPVKSSTPNDQMLCRSQKYKLGARHLVFGKESASSSDSNKVQGPDLAVALTVENDSVRLSQSSLCTDSPPKKKQNVPEEDEEDIGFNVSLKRSFKYMFDVDFSNLSRNLKSDKTQINSWNCFISDSAPFQKSLAFITHLTALKANIRTFCSNYENFYFITFELPYQTKSRAGVYKLLRNVGLETFIVEAPNVRSTSAALNIKSFSTKQSPNEIQWIHSILMDPESQKFDLSVMVQWAMSNRYLNQPEITYQYCQLAGQGDPNAKLWLASTSQVKWAKDCTTQVNMLLKGQLMSSTSREILEENITKELNENEGNWKSFQCWIKMQKINTLDFLQSLKDILDGTSKKSVICLSGPQDCGKTTLAKYLIKLLEGKFISFYPNPSNFWLQQSTGLKLICIDDVGESFFCYANKHLRSALNGTQIVIDCKFQAPSLIRLPPTILTTNLGFNMAEYRNKYPYLHNRIKTFSCNETLLESQHILSQLSLFSLADLCSWLQRYQDELGLEINLEHDS